MKTKELIQSLRECVFENQYKVCGVDVLMFQAADRLEQLEKELESVKAERDTAVKQGEHSSNNHGFSYCSVSHCSGCEYRAFCEK